MTRVISVGNFKGGVGKTTTTVLCSNESADKGNRTLIIDTDVSSDASEMIFDTLTEVYEKEIPVAENTFYEGLEIGDLSKSIIHVKENLDMIPADWDLKEFDDFLYKKFGVSDERYFYFKELLDKIKDNYDYIFIDVPPTINKYSTSAITASDYILIVTQTQMKSFRKTVRYAEELGEMQEKYALDIDALGVLPVLMESGSEYDQNILLQLEDYFGKENIFNVMIKKSKRINRYDWTGITNNAHDPHDMKIHKLYQDVLNEIEVRMGEE